MLDRSRLLSLSLVTVIAAVGVQTYHLWIDGPWDLPKVAEVTLATSDRPETITSKPLELVDSRTIIEKNL